MEKVVISSVVVGNESIEHGVVTSRDYKLMIEGEKEAVYVRVTFGKEKKIEVINQTGLLRAREFIGELDEDIRKVIMKSKKGLKEKELVEHESNQAMETERVERAKRMSNSKKADYKIAKLISMDRDDTEVIHIANKIKTMIMRYDLTNLKQDYKELVSGDRCSKENAIIRIIGEKNRSSLVDRTDDIARYIVSILRYRIAKKNDLGIKEEVKIDKILEKYIC